MRRIALFLFLAVVAGACGGNSDPLVAPRIAPRDKPEVAYARRVLNVHGHILGELARNLKANSAITPEAGAMLTAMLAEGPLRTSVEAGMNAHARRNFVKIKKNPGDVYFLVVDAERPRPDCLTAVVYGDLGLLRRPNEAANATRTDMIRTVELRLSPLNPDDDPLGVNTTDWQIAEAANVVDGPRLSCPPAS